MAIEKLWSLAGTLCQSFLLKGSSALAIASVMSCLATSPAKAELVIDFFDNFGGSTPTGSSNPLLTAIIPNETGGAEITVESFLEPPGNSEFVEQISFNLKSINPPNDTTYGPLGSPCTILSGNFSCALTTFDVEPPPINQPDIGNIVNAALNFPTSNSFDGSLRFDARDKGTFFVGGLSEELLLTFVAIDNNGVSQTLYAGAKINSITCASGTGTCSTSIGGSRRKVPGPLPLVGAATAFGFSRRLRRRLSRTEITV